MATKPKDETTIPGGIDMAAVQAQIAAMLAEAKAKADSIIAEAKKAVNPNAQEDEEKAKAKAEDLARGEELVEVKLFKDNDKYKDDVYVGVNGENCVIKRGERVKIKRKFAEVLDNSEHQDYETSKMIEAKAGEFAKSGL